MNTVLFPVNELKIGGAEQQLLELVRGLDKARFRPIVAPLYRGGALDAELEAIPGAEVVYLDRRGKYDPSPLWRIGRLLRQRRVDIIQPFLSPATFFGLLPALVVGTPVKIVTERCGVRRSRKLGYKIYRATEDALTHLADAVVPNSVAGHDLLRTRGIPEHKITVIYNGINCDRLDPDPEQVALHRQRMGAPAGGSVVGILASLTPPKGHDAFLRAAAAIDRERPDTRWAIVGDGMLRASLEGLASELGLGKKVTFFGYQRRIADYLAACDIVVSSSRDNEGCSNSILEAMALGRTVVATDIGGNGELVEDGLTGYLVPAGSTEALVGGLRRALDDSHGRQEIARLACHLVDTRFALGRMVADYESLYERLLAERQQAIPAPGALNPQG